MQFVRGNKAILNHATNGRDLLVFEGRTSGMYQFMGRFACSTWDIFSGPDKNGMLRKCIQFHFVKLSSYEVDIGSGDAHQTTGIEELRRRALEAAKPSQTHHWKSAPKSYRERSKAVRDYVLARANGHCELTETPAPFKKPNGKPYLEVHHVRRLSDDGPDDPRFVAAINPTVHREIHHGIRGKKLNDALIERLAEIEP